MSLLSTSDPTSADRLYEDIYPLKYSHQLIIKFIKHRNMEKLSVSERDEDDKQSSRTAADEEKNSYERLEQCKASNNIASRDRHGTVRK